MGKLITEKKEPIGIDSYRKMMSTINYFFSSILCSFSEEEQTQLLFVFMLRLCHSLNGKEFQQSFSYDTFSDAVIRSLGLVPSESVIHSLTALFKQQKKRTNQNIFAQLNTASFTTHSKAKRYDKSVSINMSKHYSQQPMYSHSFALYKLKLLSGIVNNHSSKNHEIYEKMISSFRLEICSLSEFCKKYQESDNEWNKLREALSLILSSKEISRFDKYTEEEIQEYIQIIYDYIYKYSVNNPFINRHEKILKEHPEFDESVLHYERISAYAELNDLYCLRIPFYKIISSPPLYEALEKMGDLFSCYIELCPPEIKQFLIEDVSLTYLLCHTTIQTTKDHFWEIENDLSYKELLHFVKAEYYHNPFVEYMTKWSNLSNLLFSDDTIDNCEEIDKGIINVLCKLSPFSYPLGYSRKCIISDQSDLSANETLSAITSAYSELKNKSTDMLRAYRITLINTIANFFFSYYTFLFPSPDEKNIDTADAKLRYTFDHPIPNFDCTITNDDSFSFNILNSYILEEICSTQICEKDYKSLTLEPILYNELMKLLFPSYLFGLSGTNRNLERTSTISKGIDINRYLSDNYKASRQYATHRRILRTILKKYITEDSSSTGEGLLYFFITLSDASLDSPETTNI